MKVVVDRGRCVGMGICESIDSTRLEVGHDGVMTISSERFDEADRAAVEEAVASCPAGSLRIIEG